MIISTLGLTTFTNFVHKGDLFQNELMKYFSCESHGYDHLNPCKRKKFEDLESDALIIVTNIFSGMAPVVNLVFSISVQDTKNKCKVLSSKMKSIPTSKTKNTTCSTAESKMMS